ncbi:uncharacterized protein A4U43_UnF8190 [Asparagus officinalis]|uniref:Uncharacterized protein n=1 Tax=Asparagus officinalis TaxID=4686 RepID=A0A1R3L610_ASPOF|nr:uncharacterized protein A4U43_UnF8190 [Asparagus officinalis]
MQCDRVRKIRRSGNPVIERCRRETIEEIQKSWKRGLEMGPRLPCKHRHCGRFDDDRSGDGWVRDDQRPRAFYGQVCKSRLTSVTSSFEIFETVAVDKILMFLLRS